MKHLLRLGCALFLSSGLLAAPSAPATGFDQLKGLVGQWEGSATPSGNTVHVSYQLVSNGTALLERLRLPDEEMISVYTADGQRVAMTHYCGANNQPQMRTEPIAGPVKRFTFSFIRATNLANPDLGHMDRVVVLLEDEDHITQEWTWLENGRANTETFRLARPK